MAKAKAVDKGGPQKAVATKKATRSATGASLAKAAQQAPVKATGTQTAKATRTEPAKATRKSPVKATPRPPAEAVRKTSRKAAPKAAVEVTGPAATPPTTSEDDPVTGAAPQPGGPGIYLHWDGRRSYRTRMPAPRVLEPVAELSYGPAAENRLIEGDNLQAMVSLRSQYRNSVDVAYLDPPYNTGKRDFRYSDRRFHDPNADSDDAVYVSNEDGGRHTKWLNYMGPRLWLTWELLADHGVCLVSINDVEMFRLGLLMDEIFGEKNRLGIIVWKQMADNNPTRIAVGHEYVLAYAKRVEAVPPVWLGESDAKQWLLDRYEELVASGQAGAALERAYQAVIREQVRSYEAAQEAGKETDLVDLGPLARYKFVDDRGPYAAVRDTAVHAGASSNGFVYDVIHPVTGKVCKKPGSGYRFSPERMRQLQADDRLIFGKDHTQLVQLKKYLRDIHPPLRGIIEIDSRKGGATLKRLFPDGEKRFANPKPVELIETLLGYAGSSDALVLDPFAGSGTTGHAVMRLNQRDNGNRRFILIEEGSPDDHYCRTLTAPRLRAAIEVERYDAGFGFETTGRQLDRDAILELERTAITNLILQTDPTGVGGGIRRIAGDYAIGANKRGEGIFLCWAGRKNSTVTRDVLVTMFEEAKALELKRPIRVYGSTCDVGETESFRFCQIPDAIMAALHLVEDPEDGDADELVDAIEALELEAHPATAATR